MEITDHRINGHLSPTAVKTRLFPGVMHQTDAGIKGVANHTALRLEIWDTFLIRRLESRAQGHANT